jgi:hypothetical protein
LDEQVSKHGVSRHPPESAEEIQPTPRCLFFQFALANELAFETLVLGFAAYHIDNLVGFGDVEYLEKHRLKALQLTRQQVEALNSHGLSNDGDLVGFHCVGIS